MHLYLFDFAAALFFLSCAAANTRTVPPSLNPRANNRAIEPTLPPPLAGQQYSPAIPQRKPSTAADSPQPNRAEGAAEARS